MVVIEIKRRKALVNIKSHKYGDKCRIVKITDQDKNELL